MGLLEMNIDLSQELLCYLVPGAWRPTPGNAGTAYQAPGTRYLVSATRYQVPNTWYLVPGTW